MTYCVKLLIKTNMRADAIKDVRHLTGWGLYEAKEAVEQGMLFDDVHHMCLFMARLKSLAGAAYDITFEVETYKPNAGPQDARGLRF